MAEIRKIIFIKNAVETLGYFSEQIALELERNGYETCFIDYERMYESMDEMLHFLEREETALVTFNFIGLRGEAVFQTESGRSIWQEENLPILNILVDHPLYYHSCLKEAGERMRDTIIHNLSRGYTFYTHFSRKSRIVTHSPFKNYASAACHRPCRRQWPLVSIFKRKKKTLL